MTRSTTARRDALVLTVATALSGLATYVFVALGTRAVGPIAFAPVSVLWSLWALSAAAITFPIQHWVIRTVEATGAEDEVWDAVPRILAATLLLSGATLAITGLAGDRLFTVDGLAFPLMTAALPLGSVVMGINRGAMAARGQFARTGAAILGENLIRVVAVVVFADRLGAAGLGWCLVGGFAVALGFPGSFRPHRTRRRRPSRSISLLGGLASANVAAQAALTSGPVLLSLLGGTEAAVTEMFAVLALLRAPYTIALGVTVRVTAPLTQRALAGEHDWLHRVERRLALGAVGLAALGGLAGAVVLPPVVRLVFDVGGELSGPVVSLLTAGSILALAGLVQMLLLLALDRGPSLMRAWAIALALSAAMLAVPVAPALRIGLAFAVVEVAALAGMLRASGATPRPHVQAPGDPQVLVAGDEVTGEPTTDAQQLGLRDGSA